LEGPEAGVYYRGQGTIQDKSIQNKNKEEGTPLPFTTITLPDYASKLANEWTVHITPICDGFKLKHFNAGKVKDNQFKVYGEEAGEFYWMAHGKRENIEVEPLVSTTQIQGTGPYKWISK
jgi:hypothetical protein